jgi:hypothetical protein
MLKIQDLWWWPSIKDNPNLYGFNWYSSSSKVEVCCHHKGNVQNSTNIKKNVLRLSKLF